MSDSISRTVVHLSSTPSETYEAVIRIRGAVSVGIAAIIRAHEEKRESRIAKMTERHIKRGEAIGGAA